MMWIACLLRLKGLRPLLSSYSTLVTESSRGEASNTRATPTSSDPTTLHACPSPWRPNLRNKNYPVTPRAYLGYVCFSGICGVWWGLSPRGLGKTPSHTQSPQNSPNLKPQSPIPIPTKQTVDRDFHSQCIISDKFQSFSQIPSSKADPQTSVEIQICIPSTGLHYRLQKYKWQHFQDANIDYKHQYLFSSLERVFKWNDNM